MTELQAGPLVRLPTVQLSAIVTVTVTVMVLALVQEQEQGQGQGLKWRNRFLERTVGIAFLLALVQARPRPLFRLCRLATRKLQ